MPIDSETEALVYLFRSCRVDLLRRRVERNGTRVDLQNKPFSLLVYLLKNRDRVVSYRELLEGVWGAISLSTSAIRYALHSVRAAIGDYDDRLQLIKTFPGVGLQFIGCVEEISVGASADRRDQSDHVFLGRAVIRDIASELLSKIPETSSSHALLLSGEPGIGKSTAIRYLSELGSQAEFTVIGASCTEAPGSPSYHPWSQILEAMVNLRSKDESVDGIVAETPEVSWIVTTPSVRKSSAVERPPRDARLARFRLLDGISRFVRTFLRRGPVLIWIDDLHRGDEESLRLLEYLFAELADQPLLIIAAYREIEADQNDSTRNLVARLSSQSTVLHHTLSAFSGHEVREFVKQNTRIVVSDGVLTDLQRKTNGNPFFLLQILRVLQNEGRLRELEGDRSLSLELPHGVRQATLSWVESLDAETLAILRRASVIGCEFSMPLVEQAAAEKSRAASAIEGAIRMGVIARGIGVDQFRFTHALVCDTIYASLPMSEKRRAHLEVARSLEAVANSLGGACFAQVGRHFAESGAKHGAVAVEWYQRAAEWELSNAGFGEAVANLRIALSILESLLPRDLEQECQLLIALGRACGLACDRSASRDYLERASDRARSLGRPDLMSLAALLYSPDLLSIETGVYDHGLVDLLERTLGCLDVSMKRERAMILSRLAVALYWSDESRDRIPGLIGEARHLADATGADDVQGYVSTASRLALYSVSNAGTRSKGPIHETSNDGNAAVDLVLRVTSLLQLGRIKEVEIAIEQLQYLASEVGSCPGAAWYVNLFGATLAQMRGEYVDARLQRQAFLEKGLKSYDANALHSYALQQAMDAVDHAGLSQVEDVVQGMARQFPRVEGWQAGLSYLYSELGKHAEARESFSKAIQNGALECPERNSFFGTLGSLALTCERLPGHESVAERIFERLKIFEGQFAVVGFGSYCWGSVDRFLGVLAGVLGCWDVGEEHLARAIEQNATIGALPAMAHAQFAMARLLRAAGRPGVDQTHAHAVELAKRAGIRSEPLPMVDELT